MFLRLSWKINSLTYFSDDQQVLIFLTHPLRNTVLQIFTDLNISAISIIPIFIIL